MSLRFMCLSMVCLGSSVTPEMTSPFRLPSLFLLQGEMRIQVASAHRLGWAWNQAARSLARIAYHCGKLAQSRALIDERHGELTHIGIYV